MVIDYNNIISWSWIGLIAFMLIRYGIAAFSNYNFNEDRDPTESENTEYNNLKTTNITLASFTVVLIALIFDSNKTDISTNTNSLFYFSISMVCFFIASYFSTFRNKFIFFYMGETIELTGIISLGIAFILLVTTLPNTNFGIYIIFLILIIGIITLASVGL